jgi:hypothetical protein
MASWSSGDGVRVVDALDLLKSFQAVAGLDDLDRPSEVGSIFDFEVSVKPMKGYETAQVTQRPLWLESIYYVITRSAEHNGLQKVSFMINIEIVCIKHTQIFALFGISFTEVHNPPPTVMDNDPKTWQRSAKLLDPNRSNTGQPSRAGRNPLGSASVTRPAFEISP